VNSPFKTDAPVKCAGPLSAGMLF